MERKKYPVLVTIQCTVYNHEPYLRKCLDGFVMQQTTFPFEAIVHDDASTDGSADVIREYAEKYPDIIKPIYETENQFKKNKIGKIMNQAVHPDAKYLAFCDGDDYWTDPNKLQMQVDIMEADEEVGLVHSTAKVFDQHRGEFLKKLWGNPCQSFEDELIVNRIITLTTCLRRDVFSSYLKFIYANINNHKPWKMGDYPKWLYMCYYSKTYFIEKPTGVYRVLQKSASHDPDIQKMADFEISAFDVKEFFARQFHHEHMLKDLATNLVYKLQDMSLREDKSIDYDIKAISREYGLDHRNRLLFMHYILKNDCLRRVYLRYLKFRMGAKNE